MMPHDDVTIIKICHVKILFLISEIVELLRSETRHHLMFFGRKRKRKREEII